MHAILRALAFGAIALAGTATAATPAFLKAQALRAEAESAMERGDYGAAATALTEALELRPGHPGITLALAAAEAESGDSDEALTHLEQFAGMGLATVLNTGGTFASLIGEPRFIGVQTTIARNLAPVGSPEIVYRLGNGRALFEGLAIDAASGRVFAGSVTERRIVVVNQGTVSDFVPPSAGLWSVFGLAIDAPRGLLWAASAAVPQTAGATPEELGAAGIFAFDLATGALKRKAVLHASAKAALGDLAVAADGTVYVSDSAGAVIYRLPPDADALETFSAEERFVSPQGLTLVANDTILVVADYAMGLYTIDVATRKMTALAPLSGTTLLGIDALTGGEGNLLLATQNGVNPQRVLRIAVGEDWSRIRQVAVLAANAPFHREITLGRIEGGQFYYIANSQWDRFGEDGATPDDAPFEDTVVARVPVQ